VEHTTLQFGPHCFLAIAHSLNKYLSDHLLPPEISVTWGFNELPVNPASVDTNKVINYTAVPSVTHRLNSFTAENNLFKKNWRLGL
jgi:hypothetical protein